MDTAQDPPSTKRARRVLAVLFVVAAVLLGLESGVAGSTGTSATPLSSPVVLDVVVEDKLEASTRPRVARRTNVRSINCVSNAPADPAAEVECLPAHWSRHAPPPWRGPPVLLI